MWSGKNKSYTESVVYEIELSSLAHIHKHMCAEQGELKKHRKCDLIVIANFIIPGDY